MLEKFFEKPVVILAPMAGYTDAPMREFVSEFGVDAVVSEMMACQEWKTGRAGVSERVTRGNLSTNTRFIVQIAGRDPLMMAEAARFAQDEGADQIDINMGCPAKKVVNGSAAGAALLLEPQLAFDIVETVSKAVNLPVSVKTRLGWSRNDTKYKIRDFENAGTAMLTIHGRTRQQKYTGNADWRAVGEIVEVANVPVIVNGDIGSAQDAQLALELSGANGVMIGRETIGAPHLPASIKSELQGEVLAKNRSVRVSDHYQRILEHYGVEFGVLNARKHLKAYFSKLYPDELKSILRETDPNLVLKMVQKLENLS